MNKSFGHAGLTAIVMLAGVGAAQAATIDWTNWAAGTVTAGTPGNATAAAGSVGVTYTGELQELNFEPSYTPVSSFSGGTVDNAPVQSYGTIRIIGGSSGTNSIHFSQAVLNPVFAIWSLGQTGIEPSFNFNAPFTIQAGGANAEYGGNPITSSGDQVFGVEGNGVIQFIGSFTDISWTNPTAENWYGFTVGVAAVPEASTWGMMLLGFAGVGFLAYRRRNALSMA
ncbi:PEP-CTERM sorting domain-containing protein [Bradyrhizobium lablabi]|uniref:PEP-CTERM sorting domain-containing protein n=1 Tax=Bradyrhizobium lablabi TaxID=722472 RepID=UPI001BA9FF27|nr:PEP-CTERM sorting domain-containing protein [Bradyrhizobium lablabi]MBR0693455.1 PEP-CTERM sorting domain-containing protein [Bradyrhizobium lablabi]